MRTHTKHGAKRKANAMAGLNILSRRSHSALPDDQTNKIMLAYHGALTGLATGYGTEELWNTVAYTLNLAMMLAEIGVRPQAMQIIQDAQLALIRVRGIAVQSGEWKLGVHSFVLTSALKQHDEQIAVATISQLRAAREELHRRLNSGNHF